MSLFVVIYISGVIGGYAGPLPYDYQECRARAQELQDAADKKPELEVRFTCEALKAPPTIER